MIKLDDSIRKYNGTKYITLYRCYCDHCGCDKGYLTKQNGLKNKTCTKCCHLNISEETRRKMSIAKIGKQAHNKGVVGVKDETRQKMRTARLGKSPSNKGKTCNKEKKIKISCTLRGIKENEFSDFTHPESKRLRNSDLSKQLTKACFERDEYTCLRCRVKGGYLHAHHVNSWKWFPEQRFEISNLVTLCKNCHHEFHSKYGNGIKEPNTSKQYEEWIREEGAEAPSSNKAQSHSS